MLFGQLFCVLFLRHIFFKSIVGVGLTSVWRGWGRAGGVDRCPHACASVGMGVHLLLMLCRAAAEE